MTLTLSQGFIDAYAAGRPEPVFIVKITNAGGEQIATMGKAVNLTYPESVASVTPVTRSLDILTRAVRVGSVTVSFHKDDYFDTLWGDRLKNQKIEILLGEASMAEVDFEPYFLGVIGSVISRESQYVVSANTPLLLSEDFEITGAQIAQHPLEFLETLLDASNLESGMKVAADFDPTDAAYTSTISHWNMSIGQTWSFRKNDPKATEAVNGNELINEAALILGGRVTEDELGRIRFVQYLPATAAADSWVDNDIQDFTILDLHRWLKNRVEVSFADFDGALGRYIANDSTSQTNFKYPAGNDLVVAHKVKTRLLDSFAAVTSTISAAATSFTLHGYSLYSFCGLRWPSYALGGSPAQPPSAALSGTLLGYIKIEDELIECSSVAVDTNVQNGMKYYNADDGSIVGVNLPMKATFTVNGGAAGRGVKGTSAAEHVAIRTTGYHNIAYDYTIPVKVAEDIITRHSNGVPVIEVTTSLAKYDLQVGDFITITSNRYRAFAKTSLTTAVKWEIIGKAVDVGPGRTLIKWTLAQVTDSALPAVVSSVTALGNNLGRSPLSLVASASANEDVAENHVVGGLSVGATSGFGISISTGVSSSINGRASNLEDNTQTLVASKDTYVGWDAIAGVATLEQTALGAGQPAAFPGQVFLAKVVTDGSAVTSVTDLRPTKAMNGEKLVDASVGVQEQNTEGDWSGNLVPNGNVGMWTEEDQG